MNAPATFPTSIEGVRSAETRLMNDTLRSLAGFRSTLQDAAAATDCPAMKSALRELILTLDAGVNDTSVTRNFWTQQIEGIE